MAQELNHFIIKTSRCAALRFFGGSFRFSVSSCSVQLQRPASSELSVPSYDKSTSARPLSSPCFLYLVRPLKSSYVAIRTLPLFCVLVCSANYMLVYLFSPNLTREMIISYSNIINLCLLIVF